MPVTKAQHTYPAHHAPSRSRQTRPVARAIISELHARGWDSRKLAARMDRPIAVVDALLGGEVLTRSAAAGLAAAFVSTAQLWLRIDEEFRELELRPKVYGKAARARRRRPAR
jgi:plasmid maintenance system antidote protein VapI